ncbi:hypothetical protein Tco_1186429 [Tanacetum coccineum]
MARTKDIKNMTIAKYMEYEAEMKRHPLRYAQSYTRSLGSTTLRRSKVFKNKHHLDKLKTNAYFPSLPPCFKPTQPLAKSTHKPLDPNDYDLCAPNSYHEDEEVSSDEDVDECHEAGLMNYNRISVEWRQHWSFGVHDRSSSEILCYQEGEVLILFEQKVSTALYRVSTALYKVSTVRICDSAVTVQQQNKASLMAWEEGVTV